MDSITAISLFSGNGGLDLGLSIAAPGIRWLCHVEREAYAAAILAARMEDKTLDSAPVWSDVTTFDGKPWHGKVDLIAGGFPCTDLSVAGKQAGINGSASGLWWQFARIICEVQPRWVFVENVPPVLSAEPARAVLGELSRLGFDAEWTTLRASEVGASHQRKRVFILANPSQPGRERSKQPELPGSLGLNEGRAATELRETPFPPGPGDTEAWQRILETNPEFAPALEPGVRGMADELASPLHERRHRLRAAGNGVVAIQAAVAFTLLMRRIMT